MSANFLRKRAIVFSDNEDENGEAWPPSPSKRRSALIASSQTQFLQNRLEKVAPPNFKDLAAEASANDETGENKAPESKTTRSRSKTLAQKQLEPPSFSSELAPLPTPPRTPTKIRSQSLSTGLTPSLNKIMMRPVKDSAITAIVEKENDNGGIPGYSTPKRSQKKPLSALTETTPSSKASNIACSAPASSNSGTSTATAPVSTTLGFYQDAKSLFRRTTEPHRLVGRIAERETIQSFCEAHILTPKAGSLYISGQPGTGKTALLKEIMRDMEPEMKAAKHSIKTVVINCMTIKDPRLVYQKLLEELGHVSESKDKDGAIKTLESLVLDFNKKKVMFVVVLDEIDQLLTKDQDVLYKLFQWSSTESSKLTLFGIANALDMTDRFLPRLKAKNCEPQLLNFNPYQVEEIRDIIMDRLFSLENDAKDNKASKGSSADGKDEKVEVRIAPLMQKSAIELCARKVAAATGDLRKALDICRQTIEMVELETKKKERLEKTQGSPQLQPQQRGLTPLCEIRLANLENQAAGNVERLGLPRWQSGGSVAGSGIPSSSLAASTAVTLQSAPKVTMKHVNKALESAFGSPMVRKMKGLNVHQKIVLAVLVMKIQSGKTVDCEVGKVFDHYTSTCRGSNKIGAVNRGEYQDLINMLEVYGLISLGKAKEERLRKVGLVPRESEVLDAIKGQEIIDVILSKAGIATSTE